MNLKNHLSRPIEAFCSSIRGISLLLVLLFAMPSLILVKKTVFELGAERDVLVPCYVNTLDTVSMSTPSWTPSVEQLMTLSLNDLKSIASLSTKVGARATKSNLAVAVCENWSDICVAMFSSSSSTSSDQQDEKEDKQPSGSDGQGGDDHHDDDGEDDDDDSEGDDPSSGSEENFFSITVKRDFNYANSMDAYEVEVSPRWRVNCLKAIVRQKWKVSVSSLLFYQGGEQLNTHLTFEQNRIGDGSQVSVRLDGLAGGGVMKRFLKKEQAVPALKTRAVSNIKQVSVDENYQNLQLPEDFQKFIDIYKKLVEDVKLLKVSGIQVIEAGVRRATDEDLSHLKDIFDFKSHRGTTEERLPQVVDILFPRLNEMIGASQKILKEHEVLMKEMVMIYVDEYHMFRSGQAMFANESFVKSIEREQIRREESRARVVPNNQSEAVAQQDANAGCSIS